ncbi:MAG: hypothetical protein ACPLXS_03610 [Candidatus Micrarchaeales archaeon]
MSIENKSKENESIKKQPKEVETQDKKLQEFEEKLRESLREKNKWKELAREERERKKENEEKRKKEDFLEKCKFTLEVLTLYVGGSLSIYGGYLTAKNIESAVKYLGELPKIAFLPTLGNVGLLISEIAAFTIVIVGGLGITFEIIEKIDEFFEDRKREIWGWCL